MKKLFMFLALMLLVAATGGAQIARVTGQVMSAEDDEPLVGASVRIKGHKDGTITDANGGFVLSGLKAGEKELEVSYVGYESQTVKVAPEVKVYLKSKKELMDEVIVVAFGKQKRESFTGSAAVVTGAQIAQQNNVNPIASLNGRVAGLQMTESNSFSGDPTMRVRGTSSLNAGNSPLIILDGMPYNGYFQDINANDIESITVMKDAASNALYGARGANGVILITTKQGQRGQTKVSFEAKWGANMNGRVQYETIDDPGQYYEAHYLSLKNYYMNAMGQSANQAHISANKTLVAPYTEGGLAYNVYNVPEGQYLIGANGKLNPEASLGNRLASGNTIYTLYPDDWLDEGTRTGFRQEYNLSLTGGNDIFRMRAALSLLDEEGLSFGSDLKRYTARLNAEYQAYKWLKIGANASFIHKDKNNLASVFDIAYSIAPIYPLYIRDGEGNILTDARGKMFDYGFGDNAGLNRPVEMNGNSIQSDIIDQNNNTSNAFNINGYATIDFLKYFSLTVNANSYITENRIKGAYNPYYGYGLTTGGSVEVSHYRTAMYNTQQLLNYNQSFGVNHVSALLGHEYTRNSNTTLTGSRTKIAMFTENTELSGAIVKNSQSSTSTLYNVEGYFVRAQYDYDNRYFASASYRRDGSSRFHPSHRWGNFWSVGAAWIMNREEWFPKTPMVNMLKLKVSYGEQGNDEIGSYRYADNYTIKNSDNQVAFLYSTKGNPNITWETVGSLNAGIDFELFNNRLSGTIDYYDRRTTDMLMYFNTPESLGYSGYYSNVGDMSNRGVEIDLNATIINTRDVQWTVNFNGAWQRNRVVKLPESSAIYNVDGHGGFLSGYNFIGEGLPVNTWYVKDYAGINDQGVATYWHTLDDGTREAITDYSTADYYLCGNSLPDFFGGFGTTLNVKGFDLSAMFNYSIGGKKYDSGYAALMGTAYGSLTGNAYHKDLLDGWSPENPDSDIPRFQYNDQYNSSFSSRFLTNASYLSFRNITVGYTFAQSLIKKLHLSKLRVFASGENLIYWTHRKGFDPREGLSYGDWGGYSPIRSVTGGLSVQF